jgi:hypothetical protein
LIGKFNHNVNKDNLPSNLDTLCLGNNFNQPVNNLPDNIKNLILLNDGLTYPLTDLPKSLKFLYVFIGTTIENLPSNLEHLMLGIWFINRGLGVIVNLPKNLKILTFECPEFNNYKEFIIPTEILPDKLEILNLATNILSIENLLNKNISSLKRVTMVSSKDDENRNFINSMRTMSKHNNIEVKVFKDCEESKKFLEKSKALVEPFMSC